MYCNYTTINGWSNATVISDDINGWNNGSSYNPLIVATTSGNLHVVWYDDTNGTWGTDKEIMYCNYTAAAGWSNATVISDDETFWNDGDSSNPSIAVDGVGTIHVVWQDSTVGPWGTDMGIIYCSYSGSTGWSNATVISDDDSAWNTGMSVTPSIAMDENNDLHVVWRDFTPSIWDSDLEIMYSKHTSVGGWSKAIVISDDLSGWNDQTSSSPIIAIRESGKLHVVWSDNTDGSWGSDYEIMYSVYTPPSGGGNPPIPGFELIFILFGLICLGFIYFMKQIKIKEFEIHN